MKNKTFFVLLALFFAGCVFSGSKQSDPNPGSSNANSAASTLNEPKQNQEAAAGSKTPEFKKLSFDPKNLSSDLKYDGKITGGARWTDANGENTLIVSEKTEKGADFSTQKIFGYLYALKDGQTRLLWKIQDFAENYCDAGKGLTSPVEVRDIDGDRVAENMFVYNLAGGCDVSPIQYKLMMHSGEKKLAVRGANAVEIEGYNQKSEKNFDEAFGSAPKEFRQSASEFWDKHVKPLRAE